MESISSGRIVLTVQAALLGLTPGDEVGEYEKLITGQMRYDGNPTPVITDAPDPVFAFVSPVIKAYTLQNTILQDRFLQNIPFQ